MPFTQQSFKQSTLFPLAEDQYFCHTKYHLLCKKVFKMSNTMGIASAFVLSSLFLSPFAMAEESPAFVAQNAARANALEQYRSELTAKAKNAEKPQQTSVNQAQSPIERDS